MEFYQWVKGFILPLPIYVLAGAFLAIASNYDQGLSSLFSQNTAKNEPLSQTATLVEPINSEHHSTSLPQLEGVNESQVK
jgi:hypothetical protein